jgi:hypothetical protein
VACNCSALILLTPIMWCFLCGGGTSNILHQYSVSMLFGTVNCEQTKPTVRLILQMFVDAREENLVSDLQEDAI